MTHTEESLLTLRKRKFRRVWAEDKSAWWMERKIKTCIGTYEVTASDEWMTVSHLMQGQSNCLLSKKNYQMTELNHIVIKLGEMG